MRVWVGNSRGLRIALLCLFLVLFFSSKGRCEVEFDRLHGSDLGMGIGARAMAMGGAFVALADDASAIFWNPAGLTQLGGHQLFLETNLPDDLSSAAVIYKPGLETFKNMDFALGLGAVNRLSFKGDSGSDQWEGYAANLLDMAMIDIGDGFSGEIDSKTTDLRLSMAIAPGDSGKISIGVNLIHIS